MTVTTRLSRGTLRYLWAKAQAVALLVFRRPQAALRRFDAMLDISPGDAYALASKAQTLGQLGDQEGAIRVQQLLTGRHPSHASAWFNLGFMLQQAGCDAHAEAAFRTAVTLQPSLDRAWYGLALSLISLGRLDQPDGAVAALRQNTALQPMSPYGWYQLARVQAQLGRQTEAEAIIDRLQRFEPRIAAQLRRETHAPAREASQPAVRPHREGVT